MDIDAKTAGMLFAAIAGGSAVGDAGGAKLQDVFNPENPGAQIAQLDARLNGFYGVFQDRVEEAQSDHQQTREIMRTNFEQVSERITLAVTALKEDIGALSARLDRLDDRKMDK